MDTITYLENVYGTSGYTAKATAVGDNRYNVEFTNGETTDSVLVKVDHKNGRPRIVSRIA
jgi:hypothetical protein